MEETKPISAVEEVAEQLREAILSGELPPGAPLPEIPLSQRFEVSRNTVREAVRRLVSEGLARHYMHRGVAVAEHTEQDVLDIHWARMAIEIKAAEALPYLGETRMKELEQVLEQMAEADRRGDQPAGVEADLRFHRTMVGMLGSNRLSQFYEGLQRELRLGFATLNRRTPQPHRVEEHQRIVDLARDHDLAGLRASITEHLDITTGELLRLLGHRTDAEDPTHRAHP